MKRGGPSFNHQPDESLNNRANIGRLSIDDDE